MKYKYILNTEYRTPNTELKVGVLGGTFDPIHNGHIVLADELRKKLELDYVLFMPAFKSPHKLDIKATSCLHRLKMLELALVGYSWTKICLYELLQNKPCYSVDSMKVLIQCLPMVSKWYFLAGSDALAGLSTWKDVGILLKMVTFVVGVRPGYKPHVSNGLSVKVVQMNACVDVSSTAIRNCIRDKCNQKFLIPDAVIKYIHCNGLYK